MCGQVGLASNTLRFQTEKRDVPPSKIVTQSCLVKMSHTYEFSQSPNKILRPALISIYESQICSDLQLQVNKEKSFNLNKCILAVRSPPLARLIKNQQNIDRAQSKRKALNKARSEGQVPSDIQDGTEAAFREEEALSAESKSEESDCEEVTKIELNDVPSIELFELLLRWLYSASVGIPQNVFDIT